MLETDFEYNLFEIRDDFRPLHFHGDRYQLFRSENFAKTN